jgi:hypothetical protein
MIDKFLGKVLIYFGKRDGFESKSADFVIFGDSNASMSAFGSVLSKVANNHLNHYDLAIGAPFSFGSLGLSIVPDFGKRKVRGFLSNL